MDEITHSTQLLSLPNVVGVGIGYKETDGELIEGEQVIVAMVERKLPLAALGFGQIIPSTIGGVPTDVIQVGRIKALKAPTEKFRPSPGGVSIGHYRITAGTFGCVVKDRSSGQRFILSNNHVLADSNEGVVGDSILQPGPYDGGKEPGDKIGVLAKYIRIDFGEDEALCPYAERFVQLSNFIARVIGSKHRVRAYQADPQAVNYVDAALALPTNDGDILDVIWGINVVPDGVVAPELGMRLWKFGRTTKLTRDYIRLINAVIQVGYGGNKVATFHDQLVAGPMSAGGDSGSLVLQEDTSKAVGLLFAGSDQTTILNPIQAVLDALSVTF